jgi:hypothetical protein
MRIYHCRPSWEESRPQIDFEAADNGGNDWLVVGEVVDGTRPVQDYPQVAVRVDHPRANQWDAYMVAGTRGLFSKRFVNLVGRAAFQGLSLLPASLNGEEYYFLRCEAPVDCFDRINAVFETFEHAPDEIMEITHYAFREDCLPVDACFVVPELPYLFATESVVDRIQAAKLKGVMLQPLP